MGWSEKAKASGGNATEGVLTDYEFTNYFPMGDDTEPGDNIYMRLEITPEGADEPVNKPLYLGSGQFLKIEEDGKTLVSSDDDGTPRLYDQGEVFKFIASLEEAGFPAESRFPDPSEAKVIDFRGMIGTRLRISNEVDEDATKKLGKRKVTKGKHKGKEFNRTWTKVTKVLELPDEDGGGKKKDAKKGFSKPVDTKGKKAKDADEDTDGDISDAKADKFLVAVLKDQGKEGKIEKSGLALAITRYAAKKKMDPDERETLRKLVTSEDFLTAAAERETVVFDPSSKKQVVALPDED